MITNKDVIDAYNGCIDFYKEKINENLSKEFRGAYKNGLKQAEYFKQLAILKERDIKN